MIFLSWKLEAVVVRVTLTLTLLDKGIIWRRKGNKHLVVAWLVLVLYCREPLHGILEVVLRFRITHLYLQKRNVFFYATIRHRRGSHQKGMQCIQIQADLSTFC